MLFLNCRATTNMKTYVNDGKVRSVSEQLKLNAKYLKIHPVFFSIARLFYEKKILLFTRCCSPIWLNIHAFLAHENYHLIVPRNCFRTSGVFTDHRTHYGSAKSHCISHLKRNNILYTYTKIVSLVGWGRLKEWLARHRPFNDDTLCSTWNPIYSFLNA